MWSEVRVKLGTYYTMTIQWYRYTRLSTAETTRPSVFTSTQPFLLPTTRNSKEGSWQSFVDRVIMVEIGPTSRFVPALRLWGAAAKLIEGIVIVRLCRDAYAPRIRRRRRLQNIECIIPWGLQASVIWTGRGDIMYSIDVHQQAMAQGWLDGGFIRNHRAVIVKTSTHSSSKDDDYVRDWCYCRSHQPAIKSCWRTLIYYWGSWHKTVCRPLPSSIE